MGSLRSMRRGESPQITVKKIYPYKIVGKKYDPDLDIKDIAKLVRKDLKAAYRGWKFSVRIERYSKGQDLDVVIKNVDFDLINPDWLRWKVANLGKRAITHNGPAHFTQTGYAVLKRIREIVNDYNFDDSDSSTDYFHQNFHARVEYDSRFDGLIERQEIETAERLGLPTDTLLAEIEEWKEILGIGEWKILTATYSR